MLDIMGLQGESRRESTESHFCSLQFQFVKRDNGIKEQDNLSQRLSTSLDVFHSK